MDRVLILVVLCFALVFFFLREGISLKKSRLYEIVIALYTFSCCFTRLYLPVYKAATETEGSFGPSLAIWPFYFVSIILIWIL